MSGRPFAPLRRPAAGYADAPTTTIPPVRSVPVPVPPANSVDAPATGPAGRRSGLLTVLLHERPGAHRRTGRHRTTGGTR